MTANTVQYNAIQMKWEGGAHRHETDEETEGSARRQVEWPKVERESGAVVEERERPTLEKRRGEREMRRERRDKRGGARG